MFGRKHDFKPDRKGLGLLNKLYITKKQRLALLKWTLCGLCMLVLSLVQDVILCGMPTDLVCCGILLMGMLLRPEECAVFCLTTSVLFYFSGSAPGPYAIAMLICLPLLLNIFRHSYLRKGFLSVILCAGFGSVLYEFLVFCIAAFVGSTTLSRMDMFLKTGAIGVAIMPVLYPIFLAIGKIGGESWKE